MSNSQRFLKYCRVVNSLSFGNRWRSRKIGLSVGLAGAITLLHPATAFAQTAISNLNAVYEAGTASSYTTTVADPCVTGSYPGGCNSSIDLNFGVAVGGTNDLRVTGFNTPAGTYDLVQLADSIHFRRIDNAVVTGERHLMFFERATSNTNMRASYVNTMEEGILSDLSNRGIDNSFSNQAGDVASNNVERIDYVITNGLSVPSSVENNIGFLILERGGNDPFKIAAITSLDANGDPASFGTLTNVATSFWGNSGINIETAVMRREESEPDFRPSHTVNSQQINGVFLSLSDLGLASGSTIYGYALFANDTPDGSTSSDLVTLSGFPTDTSGASGEGGLDLVAGGGIYLLNTVQSVSGTLYADANGNDSLTAGETTLPNGIEVVLYQDTNGNLDYDLGEEIQTVETSGNNGLYNFAGVDDGTYRIFVNTGDADIANGLTLGTPNNLEVVVAGASETDLDFGFDIEDDYGDAPDSYGDASHTTLITPTIYLGSIDPDGEADTQLGGDAGAGADGDDSDGLDDEDGIASFPVLTVGDSSYSMPASSITANGTGTLHAWIDFNKNNTFDTSEYTSVAISDGALAGDLDWSSPVVNTAGETYARFRFTSDSGVIDSTPSGVASDGEVEDYALTIVPAVSSAPSIRLAKRITAINRGLDNEQIFDQSPTAQYVNVGTNTDDDNAVNWPGPATTANVGASIGTPVESYIAGITGSSNLTAVENISVRPGDEIEYTIPFLSDGDVAAQDVLICDRIPANTTFVSDAFNGSTHAGPGTGPRGIWLSFNSLEVALTNVDDGDEIAETGANDGVGGYYFPAGVAPSAAFPGMTVNCDGTNDNGAIVVDVSDVPFATGDGTPANSYGFIRFRAVVD